MKRITAIGIVLSLLLFFGFTSPAFAGIEPSPFRAEIGAYRLNFVEGYALTASQMIKAVLASPPDDKREVFAIKRLARQLNKLERLMALTAIDVIQFMPPPDDSMPPPDDMIPAINELSAIVTHAKSMVEALEAYLSTPSDDTIPPEGFKEALEMLLESAKGLHDSTLGYVDEMTVIVTPGLTEINAVCNGEMCELIEPEQEQAYIVLKGRSSIHLQSDFFSEFTSVELCTDVTEGPRCYDITEHCEISQRFVGSKNSLDIDFDTRRLPIGPNTWAHYTIQLHPLPTPSIDAKTADSILVLTHGGTELE